MPSSDYTTVGGGLKLKGAKDAGIDKKRKKKKKPASSPKPESGDTDAGEEATTNPEAQRALEEEDDGLKAAQGESSSLDNTGADASVDRYAGKTETERRHEEMRRKRLDERLKREGIKTHKERVEELNKYLSNMSEHHDMPRIGPG